MFKKEITFLTDLNLNKLQILGDRFLIGDVEKSNIHPAISQYISANIDRQILLDRLNIVSYSSFDYSGERIKNYYSLIADEIKRTQIFEYSYIKQILQDAVNFNVSFLISPNKTLLNFIFDSSNKKTAEEVINGISHAYYYRYVQKILFTYLDKKNIISITKDEFQNLLERIDLVSKETHLEDTLTTAVNSISNFIVPQTKTSANIPLYAIRQYLEEKKLSEFKTKLDNKFGDDESQYSSTSEVLKVLLSVTPVGEIVVEETNKIEDELVEDEVENSELTNTEILEPTDDDEIPNNEILSNDNLVEGDEVFVETPEIENDDISSDEDNLLEQKTSDDKFEGDDEEVKKKTESDLVLDNTVDLTPVYNSLAAEPKPFENIDENQIFEETISSSSEELNFQIDTKNVKDELSIFETTEQTSEIEVNNKSIDDDSVVDNKFDVPSESESDLNEAIDEVVNDQIIEEEFIEKTNGIDKEKLDSDEVQNLDDLISDEKLVLMDDEDDEITEVFKDLSFLDQEETKFEKETEAIKEEELNKIEVVPEEDADYQPKETEHFTSFGELTSTKDMAKIIESIFDYDMEDYHTLVDNISTLSCEDSAYKLLNAYCETNHIDIHSKETEEFKSYISQYFSKVMS